MGEIHVRVMPFGLLQGFLCNLLLAPFWVLISHLKIRAKLFLLAAQMVVAMMMNNGKKLLQALISLDRIANMGVLVFDGLFDVCNDALNMSRA